MLLTRAMCVPGAHHVAHSPHPCQRLLGFLALPLQLTGKLATEGELREGMEIGEEWGAGWGRGKEKDKALSG